MIEDIITSIANKATGIFRTGRGAAIAMMTLLIMTMVMITGDNNKQQWWQL